MQPKPLGFVVFITRRGFHRGLHFMGSCYRVPGVHYRDLHVHEDLLPGELDVDSRCETCFPAMAMVEDEEQEDFCSSLSYSDSGKGPAAK